MNIVTGSSGGLGKLVYEEFQKSDSPVVGIDILSSSTTDIVTDLSEFKNINNLTKKISSNINSITFTHAIGNSTKEIDSYSLSQYKYINADSNLDFLEEFSSNLNENASVVFISSVHSIATNKQSGSYSISNQNLESLYRFICLDNSKFNFKKCMLRIGAMNTNMLTNNVNDLDGLIKEVPSESIIEPENLAKFIIDVHSNYKYLLDCSILQIDGGVLFKLGTD